MLEPSFVESPRKRWTRREFEELSNGPLIEERFELVDGDLVSKIGKNRPHSYSFLRIYKWLIATFGFDFVSPEAPIDVAQMDNLSNRPEPDLALLNQNVFELVRTNPQPDNLRLVIEISDTTLAFDLSVKARLYAKAEIVEYWVLDVSGRRMIVHRDAQGGKYQSVVAYSETERIASLAAPAAELRIADVLPPVE